MFLREFYCRKTVSKIAASNRGYGRLRFLLKTAVTVTVRFPSQHYRRNVSDRCGPRNGRVRVRSVRSEPAIIQPRVEESIGDVISN
jgi:hypothetical protein